MMCWRCDTVVYIEHNDECLNKWLVEFNLDKTVNIDFSKKKPTFYRYVNFGGGGRPSINQVKSHTHFGP